MLQHSLNRGYGTFHLLCTSRNPVHLLTNSLHVKVMYPYPKEIVLVPNNRNVFPVNRHLATATEYNLLFSLPKITASQYSLTRAISDHLTIRSSCVPGCNVVAEGGQSWCGTRNLKTINKKNENSRCTSTLPQHCTPPNRRQPKVKAYLLGRETRDTGAKKKRANPQKGARSSSRMRGSQGVCGTNDVKS